jgi:thiamine-phosphate pyrophosphorylase
MAPDTLRIIDANLNRAREALRVVEDYARFSLDSAALAEPLKALRHDLAAATNTVAEVAILYRDTAGDVGTDLSTPSERRREDLASAVTAAGKRFGEAARVIEELLKIGDPDAAGRVEALRYRFYDLESRIALTLRPAELFARVRIYVLITEAFCRAHWLATAEQAVAGGADVLQLREPGMPAGELLARARRLRELCREAGGLLIINDRPDIALIASADGVHVGQGDLPADAVRRLVGPRMLVGVSTHTLEQVRQARLAGADYVGVGPVFASSSKPRPEMEGRLPGLQFARDAAGLAALPTVAIAGISPGNAKKVWETGVRALAVGSAVTQNPDPARVVRELRTGIPGHVPAS